MSILQLISGLFFPSFRKSVGDSLVNICTAILLKFSIKLQSLSLDDIMMFLQQQLPDLWDQKLCNEIISSSVKEKLLKERNESPVHVTLETPGLGFEDVRAMFLV